MRQIRCCSEGRVANDELVRTILDESHVFTEVDCIDSSKKSCGECKNTYCVLFEKEDGSTHIVTGRETPDFFADLSKITKRKYA